jgi:hypothetical protein
VTCTRNRTRPAMKINPYSSGDVPLNAPKARSDALDQETDSEKKAAGAKRKAKKMPPCFLIHGRMELRDQAAKVLIMLFP